MAESESSREFARALVRFNSHVMGLTAGLIAAVGLFAATLLLLIQGGENVGGMLNLLHNFFPGYSVTVSGAFVGAAWAGLGFYLIGAIFARAYGPWLLRHVRRESGSPEQGGDLGRRVALLSPLPVAVTAGALLALGLFAAHNWLLFRSEPGQDLAHLRLLGNYLPGYGTDLPGSLVGAFWVFLYGFAAVLGAAWIYNTVATARRPKG